MMAATTGSSGLPLTLRLLSAALITCSVSALQAQELAVTAVRYWSLSDVTRIAIETNNPFTFRTDRLHKPERAFFDLKDTRPKLDSKGVYAVAVNDPRVRQIRVAEPQKMVTRIVLDLEDGQFDISTSQLSVPNRLIIEVRPSSGELNPRPVLSMTGVRNIPTGGVAAKVESSSAVVDEPAKRRLYYPAQPLSKFADPPVLASRNGSVKVPPVPAAEWRVAPRPETPEVAVPPVHSKPAGRNSNGDRSLTRALGLKIRRVVLDPGHGGYDHGTTGPAGLTEKELVLDVAKRLGTLLQETLGSEVIFTRSTDTFIPLEERTVVANAKKADLLLSIHANSSPVRTASGVETYYLSTTTSRASLDVAARENAASQMSISDLRDLLQKIVLRDKLDESREFAAKVQDSLIRFSTVANPPKPGTRRDRGVKRAPFVVLIGAQMPAILTEIGFVTNSKEEGLLKRPEYRQKIAEAILAGVRQYAESLSQFEVAQTQKRGGSE
jgi:N-acetylmuramoyl-L-alanine amidase